MSSSLSKQNCRIWGSECPQYVYMVPQGAESITVYCIKSVKHIIGLHVFESESTIRESYKKNPSLIFF